MKKPKPYIHRDISWLSFNYRVLQEAKDPNVPLYERIKFLAIYSSNLGEFYRVRVSNHKNLIRAGKKTFKDVEFQPKQIVRHIIKIVTKQQEEFSKVFAMQILPELEKEGISIVRQRDLTAKQLDYVIAYFNDHLIPHVQPMLLKGDMVKPFLQNGALYLGVYMRNLTSDDNEKYYAIVTIPSEIQDRFIEIPTEKGENKRIIILDDIIRIIISNIFPGFEIRDSYSIKLSRDAELYIDDEYQGDFLEKIKKSLQKRDKGPAARLVYDRTMPKHFLEYLQDVFDIKDMDLLPEGRYHNNFDFMNFPSFGSQKLKNVKLPPIEYAPLSEFKSFFKQISKRDHLLYFPYHSYETVIRFFEIAAQDEFVTHIKILQYRVAKDSRIMDAIIKAVKNGKSVTAFIEVKARFDEEANLSWGEKLASKGVKVIYNIPGLKVHAKLALVRRVVKGNEQHYSYLSTGNFHEGTAKLYTDFGMLTCDPKLINEIKLIFKLVETREKPTQKLKHLGVGAVNLKEKLKDLINKEIHYANQGKKAAITLKMNSLQDREMIDLLYKASQTGVVIKMIVRGICSLVPNIKGISENITVVSIIDRFLEHARVYMFYNNGKEKIYMASADWMVRNLHHRIECMFPIYDEQNRKMVKDIIKIQLADNVKARVIDDKNLNKYKSKKGASVRSQYDTYYYVKNLHV